MLQVFEQIVAQFTEFCLPLVPFAEVEGLHINLLYTLYITVTEVWVCP